MTWKIGDKMMFEPTVIQTIKESQENHRPVEFLIGICMEVDEDFPRFMEMSYSYKTGTDGKSYAVASYRDYGHQPDEVHHVPPECEELFDWSGIEAAFIASQKGKP